MTAFVVAVSPETASESVVDLAPRNFSRTAEPMETPAMVLACECVSLGHVLGNSR